MFATHDVFSKFCSEVANKRRFVFSDESEAFLEEFRKKIKNYVGTIKSGDTFCRARKGYDLEDVKHEGTVVYQKEVPLPPEDMKPLDTQAKDGRINPKGISYLYLSNDKDTAISEVRPWFGEYVSLGYFKITKDLEVICFTENKEVWSYIIMDDFNPPKEEFQEKIWLEINEMFATPIEYNDQKAIYAPTQILAEIIKDKGFDGVVYKSKIKSEKAYNIALFDKDVANLFKRELYQIDSIKYSYIPAGQYWVPEKPLNP